jgi:hypothetical protein
VGELLKAASDFFAAVLGAAGFVGRPRRRAAIRDDLELLRDLEKSPEFGPGTWTREVLTAHITLEVARHAGVDLPRRKIAWGSIVMAFVIGAPLAYLTYRLDRDGFEWWSLLPGIIAGLMFIAILGMLFNPDEASTTNGSQPAGDDGVEAPASSSADPDAT